MPSPFPGMDPYLEAPGVWPDFHDRLADEISSMLNAHLPGSYYAQLGSREEIGILGDESHRRIIPNVAIERTPGQNDAGGVATITEVGESVEVEVAVESLDPEEVNFVEIRDANSKHDVVTIIEILSPANKSPGKDQGKYLIKRDEILGSSTSLIEIDLLRGGNRTLYGLDILRRLSTFSPPPEYLVLISRSWNRSLETRRFQLFPAYLIKPLPAIPIPLRDGEPEPTLDLQMAVNQTYDRGPYARGAVNYTTPTDPPIAEHHREWVTAQLAANSARPAPSGP